MPRRTKSFGRMTRLTQKEKQQIRGWKSPPTSLSVNDRRLNLVLKRMKPLLEKMDAHKRSELLWGFSFGKDERENFAYKLGSGQFGPREISIPCLELLLRDPSAAIRGKAMDGLVKLRSHESIPLITSRLMDPDSGVQMDAVGALNGLGARKSVPQLIQLLHNPRVHHPYNLAMAFRSLMGRKCIPILHECLSDPNSMLKSFAINELKELHSQKSIPLLERCLSDPVNSIRFNAAEALASFGKPMELYKSILERHPFADFANPSRRIMRAPQKKSGSKTILLGGRLAGKATVRVISKSAADAWVKAAEAGIPVEPILKKNGKYRIFASTKPDFVRVSTGVIQGSTITMFLSVAKNDKKYGDEILRQKRSIQNRLQSLGIVHGHDGTPGNWIVRLQRSKDRKLVPKVYLIDFDEAEFQ